MIKHNYFVKILKKINLLINNLLRNYLNKLNFNNFSNIIKSSKIFLTFVALIISFLSYLLIPNVYDKTEISKQLKNQLFNKFSLNFNFSPHLKYNFFPRPHFTYEDSTMSIEQNEISRIKKLKIYVSLNNFFSLDNVKVNNLILENANFNLNYQNHDFFIKLLDKNFKDINFTIKDSNIFYRNDEKEVLIINKIRKIKYYYDTIELKNVFIAKNEIFNVPYSLELYKDKTEKKILSKLNLDFLKLNIINEVLYENDIIQGTANLIINQNKSNAAYKLKKNSFNFKLVDKFNKENFSYKSNINFKPFYASLYGTIKKIDLSFLFYTSRLIPQLLKTEILNNTNLNFHSKITGNKIKNYENFKNIFLSSKIQEGLIDFDNTKFSWKDYASFKISNSLLHVKKSELFLDGKLDIEIKNSQEIYKKLLTPKNHRTRIKKIELNFNYNFDQKILDLNDIKIDNKLSNSVNSTVKSLMFKNYKIQNKIYLKKIFNKAIKAYVG
jgi:hypothetical protein